VMKSGVKSTVPCWNSYSAGMDKMHGRNNCDVKLH
jgi:hypothetical protein